MDHRPEQALLRLGLALSATAASILIISLAWFWASSPSAGPVTIRPAPPPAWERLAAGEGTEPTPDGHSAATAAARTAQWMLESTRNGPVSDEH